MHSFSSLPNMQLSTLLGNLHYYKLIINGCRLTVIWAYYQEARCTGVKEDYSEMGSSLEHVSELPAGMTVCGVCVFISAL